MLADEKGMQGREPHLFICPDIARQEEARRGARSVVKSSLIIGQEIAQSAFGHLELTAAIEFPEGKGALVIRSIDL